MTPVTKITAERDALRAQLDAVLVDAIREVYVKCVDELWASCISAQLLEIEDWLGVQVQPKMVISFRNT